MRTPLEELDEVLRELTSTHFGRRAFLASLPLLMAACATHDHHREREGNLKGGETSLSVTDEQNMTKEVLPQMRKDYPPVNDPYLQNYISSLGVKLAKANDLEGKPYHYNFTVVGVNYVNAFALPAGTVFVTAPLIAMADSEAELAGVVGHEIGHVKSRHTAQRMDRAKREESDSWKYAVGGGVIGAGLGFGLGKLLCGNNNACVAKATALGAAAGAGGGLLVQKYAFMANSREDEMEADRIGFKTSVHAYYSKEEAGKFYSKLLTMEKQAKQNNVPLVGSLQDAMATHPPSEERVKQMQELAATTPANPRAITNTKEFDQAKKLATLWVQQHQKG